MPDPGDPQSLNRYSYAANNPVKYVDPTGHCEETGDEACWGVYEQIIEACPECATLTRAGRLADRRLDQESIFYLRHILRSVQSGWTPSGPKPFVSGVSLNGGLLRHGIIGAEKLTNPRNGKTTYFVYAGQGMGIGGGGSMALYTGDVEGLEDDNLAYSGNFVTTYVTAAEVLGATTTYAYALTDNPLQPEQPHVFAAGAVVGEQVDAGVTLTEYVPILTIDQDGSKTWNIDNYLFDPEFTHRGIGGKTFFNAYGHSLTKVWRFLGGN